MAIKELKNKKDRICGNCFYFRYIPDNDNQEPCAMITKCSLFGIYGFLNYKDYCSKWKEKNNETD